MRRQEKKCGMRNGEWGIALRPIRHSPFPIAARRGLTLIELLVTIVIMVTVLAGVIPLMSPNNNSRKIREASRQLTTMLAQAQAQAARDGRPAGVAFREFDSTRPAGPYSGMALEAFFIAEPEAFTGFSAHSRVAAAPWPPVLPAPSIYGPDVGALVGNKGTQFSPEHDGRPLYTLTFSIYGANEHLPPQMFKIGDIIELESGNQFLICDDADQTMAPNQTETVNGVEYLLSDLTDPIAGVTVDAIWLNNSGQAMQPAGTQLRYAIRRLPTNSSEAPLQLPRGIGIDLQASGIVSQNLSQGFDVGGPDVIGIMYGPTGALDAVYHDGERQDAITEAGVTEPVRGVFLLLGIFENGNDSTQEHLDYNFHPPDNTIPIDRDLISQRRSRINWLNPDTRWVVINRAGRTVASGNNIFDPSQSPHIDDLVGSTPEERSEEQRLRQLSNAREFAEQMQTEGGR